MSVGMFLLVVAAGAASVGIFYFEGSQAAVMAQVAVVPLLVVVGYLWVNRTVQSTGTSRTEFERRKARQLGEQFRDSWQLAQEIEYEHSSGISDAEWEQLNRHANNLQSNGIEFDPDTGTFEINDRKLGSLEDINRLETETDDLNNWLTERFSENVRSRISAVNTTLDRLSTFVATSGTIDPSAVSESGANDDAETWTETATYLEDCYQEADRVIENACNAIQEAATNTEQPNSQLDTALSQARDAAGARQYDKAVTNVLNARDMAERDVSGAFNEQEGALTSLLRTAAEKPIDDYLGQDYDHVIKEYKRDLQEIDEVIEISELRSLREDCRSTCLDIVEELSTQLEGTLDTLEAADVPEGWYERPPASRTNYVRALQASEDIESFHNEFDTAVDSLLSALDSVKPKASVVSGYSRMEQDIREQLRTEGAVAAVDLPVSKHEEQFLGLYYRKHMEQVNFDPNEPRLSAQEGGETYTVTVTAMFPEGGTEREVEISVSGNEDRTATCWTPLVAEATFEELPYGEYTLQVAPVIDEYSTIQRTITVDSEMTIEFDLEQLSLREQLCKDSDIDVEGVLSNLSARFESDFEESGHLSTGMEFPVDEEYIPCLFAHWAEKEGHEATQYEEDVVVYDSEQLTKEIENVIRYNLSVGDTRSFEELRSNFLSAPVPDSTIRDLAGNSSEQAAISVEGTQITKEET